MVATKDQKAGKGSTQIELPQKKCNTQKYLAQIISCMNIQGRFQTIRLWIGIPDPYEVIVK